MALRLNGATSGYTEINAPATAGNNTLVLPTGNGTNGQFLQTDGSGALSWGTAGSAIITLGTAQSSTSGTSIEFTGIPSWANRITVIFSQVSTSGVSDPFQIQVGTSSGYVTSGYASTALLNGAAVVTSTVGFLGLNTLTNTLLYSGRYTIYKITGNTWVGDGLIQQCSGQTGATGQGGPATGNIALAGTLDRLRIIAGNAGTPSATFDAGTINILYEG